MKILILISRIIVSVVFIFSGLMKAIDPVGSQIKFEEYFEAFGMEFLVPIALYLAIALAAIEFTLGVMLLIKVKPKTALIGIAIFMLIFTPLTLILAINNPVSDCGCFGDAVKITNWQTFFKNIIIDIFLLILFIKIKKIKPFFAKRIQNIVVIIFLVFSVSFEFYNVCNLPFIDFLPFKVGNNIKEQMSYPPNAQKPVYEMVFIYKNSKTGQEKEFLEKDLENINYDEWTFVDRKDKVIKEGYIPPIHDFEVQSIQNGNITEEVLSANYAMLIIAPNLEKANKDAFVKINKLYEKLKSKNIKVYGLTASNFEYISKFVIENKVQYEFCNVDETTLKTAIRSNPGIILLRKGTVKAKWHYNNIPEDVN